MQTSKTKHAISVMLIVGILTSGLPIFSAEDANRNTRVNLEDLILHVKEFAQSADNPESFAPNIKKIISALHVVAGLKTIIIPEPDARSLNTLPCLNLPYLLSSNIPLTPPHTYSQVIEKPISFQSILSSPDTPPPQSA